MCNKSFDGNKAKQMTLFLREMLISTLRRSLRMSYCEIQLIINWYELIRRLQILLKISETKKISSISSTPYKVNKKSDIKQNNLT